MEVGHACAHPTTPKHNQHFLLHTPSTGTFWFHEPLVPLCRLSALMSDAVAHTLDGCEVQPLGEELNPEREELLVDMDVVRERGLEIINTTAYIAITGNVHIQSVLQGPWYMSNLKKCYTLCEMGPYVWTKYLSRRHSDLLLAPPVCYWE